jgi:hypothetical protein
MTLSIWAHLLTYLAIITPHKCIKTYVKRLYFSSPHANIAKSYILHNIAFWHTLPNDQPLFKIGV